MAAGPPVRIPAATASSSASSSDVGISSVSAMRMSSGTSRPRIAAVSNVERHSAESVATRRVMASCTPSGISSGSRTRARSDRASPTMMRTISLTNSGFPSVRSSSASTTADSASPPVTRAMYSEISPGAKPSSVRRRAFGTRLSSASVAASAWSGVTSVDR